MKKLFNILLASMLVIPLSGFAKMNKQEIFSKNAPAPIGTYSQAIKTGNTIFLSGQIPTDKTGELVKGDFNVQFRQAVANLAVMTKAAGGDLNDIVKLTIYVTDLGNFPVLNQVMSEKFQKPYPARVVVEVKDLPEHAPVEIEAVMEK